MADGDSGDKRGGDDGDRSTRVLTLLRLIASAEQPPTANEISVRAGLPKATVYRLCDQLIDAGFIRRQVVGRGFVPAAELVTFAEDVLSGRAVYIARHAVLQRVSRATGETCNLVVPDGSGMVYWDRVETEWPLRLQLPVGTAVPFHATASGKMYLASLPPQRRRRVVTELALEPYTPQTIVSHDQLHRHLEETAQRGFSLDNEEFIEGMTAIAVPILSTNNRCVGALAVHAPKTRMTVENARNFVTLLQDAAERLRDGVPEAGGIEAEDEETTS
ncbi:MAG: IclR family transcriptional regulator [Pseudomonadota bacterium]